MPRIQLVVQDNSGNSVVTNNVTAAALIRNGGTASQFLKADGSVDSNAYITSSAVGNGTLTLAVAGSGLTGSASFTANQSGASTFTVTSNATSSNNANTLVFRDASGSFNAGNITASLIGNASTAAAWQTARTITIGSTGKSVDGSGNVSWSLAEIGAQAALGFTPENSANKGVANGYASLDAGAKVPAAQLPSYVDDVLEYANLAAFPATGETAKIYVTLDTNRTYRWSGSAYVEISASPGSTDVVSEGSTNLYFTNTRARQAISLTVTGSSGASTYNNSTGVLNVPTYTLAGLGGQPALNGTGFVRMAGTTVSYITGTSAQFVKADGSLDSNVYLTSLTDTLATVTARGNTTTANIGAIGASPINFVTAGNIGTWIGGVQDATTGWSLGSATIGFKSDNTTYAAIGIASANGPLYFGRTTASGVGTMASWLTVSSSLVANFVARPQHAGNNLALISEIPTVNNGTLTLAVSGTGLSGSASFTANQSGNTTFTVTSNATSANTASAIVARDASGNFSTGRITTTGLYGPSTTGNIAIWQYDASNTGYGIVYNEGTPDTLRIDVSGQALTGTPDFLVGSDYAQINGNTVWHAGNLTNLNQLTNGPGYTTNTGTVTSVSGTGTVSGLTLTGSITTTGSLTLGGTLTLTSQNVTTALGFTPYNSTNPSGYTSNTGTVTSVGGTGTVSGLTLTGTVTSSGNLTLGGTLSASIDNITDEHRLFNNMGDSHSTRTSFDATTASYNFGWRFVQGSTNGPGVNSATQYYQVYVGLGNDYPATGAGSYGMQLAIPRNVTTPYIAVRYNENNVLAAWQKISAGYADSAGILATARTINGTSFNGSANITTASWGTARTITIGSTGKSVDGSANVLWSLAEIGAQAALGFTPENSANKGAVNGYASLDAGGKVPAAQLPSYVDDVLEYANLAGFPATGETGKIYVTLDTNKTYRWSGSAYVEIASSPGSTDSVTEGTTNLYYTNTRARLAISMTNNGTFGGATYNNATGVINVPNYSLAGLGGQPLNTNLTSLSNLTFASTSFVKMTAAGTFALDTNTYYLASNPNGYTSNTGTVTSVALSLPAIFSVSGSPVTTTGTLTATLASQTANTFFAAPNGSAGSPSFRAIVAADIPTLNQNTTGSAGSVANSFVVRADSGTTEGTDIYTFNGSAAKNLNIVAGTNVTITKTAGQWTIAATGGGGTTLNGTGFVRMSGTTVSYVTGTASQFVKADGSLDSTSYQTALTNPVTGTGTSGQISYWSGTTTQTGSANLVYDAANVRLNIGGGVTGFLNPSNANVVGSTALVGMTVKNTSTAAGTTQAGFYVENSTSNGQLYKAGTGYTTYKIINANDLGFYNAAAGDISILNDFATGQIRFAAGGSSNPHFSIASTGATTFSNNATFLSQIIVTQANNVATGSAQIYLNGATGNRIDFNSNGLANPTVTTRSAGTKILLRSTISGTTLDYAIGMANGIMWMSLPSTANTNSFRIISGSTIFSAFNVTGDGNVTAGNMFEASTISALGILRSQNSGTLELYNADNLAYIQLNTTGSGTTANFTWIHSPTTRNVVWSWSANTANRTYTLPNASGTIPVSVNGQTADANGNITISTGGGGGGYTVTSQTANYTETATSGTRIILCNTTGGAFTVTLPTAVGNGATIIIKKTAGTPILTIDGAGTETIDGDLTALIYDPEESITLISDNANWLII